MNEGPQLFGSLTLASHRNGSPIKLPRAQDEVVMLAFDQRNSRLVELHVLTGKAVPTPLLPGPPGPTKRRGKPSSWQSRRKWSQSRHQGSNSQPGRCRHVRNSRVQARRLHRFYEPKTSLEQAEVKPEIVREDVQLHACELLRAAAVVRGQSFMTILEVGMDDGLVYYVTHLNDGEFVQEYVQRRGAVPTVASLALVNQLLQDLGRAEEQGQLPPTIRLDRVLVTSQEEEYLQLRLFDYGLAQTPIITSCQTNARLVGEACQLLFLLMTGQVYPGGNPEDFGVVAELPANLRFVLKSVLISPADHPISSKTLRDEVREAMCSHVTLVQARNPKLLRVAEPSTLPISHLQSVLLGDIPLKTLFGASFRIQNPELSGTQPFAISAVNVSAEQPVTLHLLPPERIVRQSGFMAFPPQVWRQDPARQTNILHMMSLWKGPDWAFLSEAHEPGMSLSALMAKRGTLNPGEVITLLRQIHAGLEQAAETGVQRVDLDPANIQLCVGYDGPVLPRDLERLHQKRLDAWPKFAVKIRLHKTMRSLCKPRLIDLSPWENPWTEERAGIAAREERHRSFLCLAAYLLTGEGQMQAIAEFPTHMSEQMVGYLRDCLQRVLGDGTAPSPIEFTDRLSHLLTAASVEMDSVEDPLALPDPMDSQEVVSAGFVSDFAEDWAPAEAPVDHARKTLLLAPVSSDLQSLDFHRPSPPQSRFPWLALAATLMLLGAVAWMILGDLPADGSMPLAAVPTSSPSEAVPVQEITEPTPKPAVLPSPQPIPQPIIYKIPVLAAVEPPAQPPSPAQVIAVVQPPQQEAASSSPVLETSKPEDSAPSMPGSIASKENQPTEKMAAARQSEPQLVAAGNTAGSLPAPDAAPLIIRRAISIQPQNAAPSSPAVLSQKETPPQLLAPLPAPVMAAPAPASLPEKVAAREEVTIRHAIVLTPEEINETLRAQTPARKRTSRKR